MTGGSIIVVMAVIAFASGGLSALFTIRVYVAVARKNALPEVIGVNFWLEVSRACSELYPDGRLLIYRKRAAWVMMLVFLGGMLLGILFDAFAA